MEYNKKQFIKSNDKKVLHKVKKNWVVLSMSLLALLGGGAVAHQTAVHADPNNKPQPTDPASALKDRINTSLTKEQLFQSQQNSQSNNAVHNNPANIQRIDQQAKALHDQIVNNAASDQQRTSDNSNRQLMASNDNQKSSFAQSAAQSKNNSVLSKMTVDSKQVAKTLSSGDVGFQPLPKYDSYGHEIINLHSHGIYYKYVIQGRQNDVVHLPGNNQYVKFGNNGQLLDSNNNPYHIPGSINVNGSDLVNSYYTFSDEAFSPEYVSYQVTPNLKFYSGLDYHVIDKNTRGMQHSITVNGYVGEPYAVYANGNLIGQYNGYRQTIHTDNIPQSDQDYPLYAVINSSQNNSNQNTWIKGRNTLAVVSQPARPITFQYEDPNGNIYQGKTYDNGYVDDELQNSQIENDFNQMKFSTGTNAGDYLSQYYVPQLSNYHYSFTPQNFMIMLQRRKISLNLPVEFREINLMGEPTGYTEMATAHIHDNYGGDVFYPNNNDISFSNDGINPFTDHSKYSIYTNGPIQLTLGIEKNGKLNSDYYKWEDAWKNNTVSLTNNGTPVISFYDNNGLKSLSNLYVQAPTVHFWWNLWCARNVHDIQSYDPPADQFGANDIYNWPDAKNAEVYSHTLGNIPSPHPMVPVGTIASFGPYQNGYGTNSPQWGGPHNMAVEYTAQGPKWLYTQDSPNNPTGSGFLKMENPSNVPGSHKSVTSFYDSDVYYESPVYANGNSSYTIHDSNGHSISIAGQWVSQRMETSAGSGNSTQHEYFYPVGAPINLRSLGGWPVYYNVEKRCWYYQGSTMNPEPVYFALSKNQNFGNNPSEEVNLYQQKIPLTVQYSTVDGHILSSKKIYGEGGDYVYYKNGRVLHQMYNPLPNAMTSDIGLNMPSGYVYDANDQEQAAIKETQENGQQHRFSTVGAPIEPGKWKLNDFVASNYDLPHAVNNVATIYVEQDPSYAHLHWDNKYHTVIGKNTPGTLRAVQVNSLGHPVHYTEISSSNYQDSNNQNITTYMPNESLLDGPDLPNEQMALAHYYDGLRPKLFDIYYNNYGDGHNYLQSITPTLSDNGKVATWTYFEQPYGEIDVHYISSDGVENHPVTPLYGYYGGQEDLNDAINDDQQTIYNYSHQAPAYVLLDSENPDSKRYDLDELLNNSNEVHFASSPTGNILHNIYIYFETAHINTNLKAHLDFKNYDGSSASPQFNDAGPSQTAVNNAEYIQASALDKKVNNKYRFYAVLPDMPNQLTSDNGTVYTLTKSQNLVGNYDSYDDKTDGTNSWVDPNALPAYTYQAKKGQAVIKLHDVSGQRHDETDNLPINTNAGSRQNLGYQELSSNLIPDGYQIATQSATDDDADQHLSEYKLQDGGHNNQNETILDIAPAENWSAKVKVLNSNGSAASADNYDDTSVLNALQPRVTYVNDSYNNHSYSGHNNYDLSQMTLPKTITGYDGTVYYLQGNNVINNQVDAYDFNNHKWQNNNEPTYTYQASQQAAKVEYYDDDTNSVIDATKYGLSNNPVSALGDYGLNYSYNPVHDINTLKSHGFQLETTNYPTSFPYNNQTYVIHFKHALKPYHENTRITANERIDYQVVGDPNKNPAAYNKTITLYQRSAQQDQVTGAIDYGQWQPTDQLFSDVNSPAISGYTPDQGQISAPDIDNNLPTQNRYNYDYTIHYNINGSVAFHYVDEDEGHDISNADQIMHGHGTGNYDPKNEINNLLSNGYMLDSSHSGNAYHGNPIAFTYTGTNQDFYIYLKHGVATASYNHPGQPGTVMSDSKQIWPDDTGQNSLRHDNHEDIEFQAAPGISVGRLPQDVHLTTTYGTTVKVDKVTGQVISRIGSLVAGPGMWGSVKIPQVKNCNWFELGTSNNSGYAASNIPATTPNRDISEVITYRNRPIKIDFVLSGKNVPSDYQGITGVISFDTKDYQGNDNYNMSYTFNNNSDGYNGSTGVRGLSSDFRIAGNQTVPYDGLTHRIQIVPDTKNGIVNYVYQDSSDNLHTVRSTSISGDYGVQIHINGRNNGPDEVNPNSILDSSDHLKGNKINNNSDYRLVNQDSGDNSFLFGDGRLVNHNGTKNDDPASPEYNPTNNVFNLPVVPVNAGQIDINYINETGQRVGYKTFNGSYGDSFDTPSKDSHGNIISDKITDNNPDKKDYRIALSNTQLANILDNYHYDSDNQTITVPLVGNQTHVANDQNQNKDQNDGNNAVKVNVKVVDSDGNQINSHSDTININGQIGNFAELKPSDLLNKNSKYYDSKLSSDAVSTLNNNENSDHVYYLKENGNYSATLYNTKDQEQPDPNNDRPTPRYVPTTSAEPNASVNFTYVEHTPQPIVLTYKDAQTGEVISGSDNNDTDNQDANYQQAHVINPKPSDYGKSINVTDPSSTLGHGSNSSDRGENIPDGYTLADSNIPNTTYSIKGHRQYVTVYVKSLTNNQKVTNADGKYPMTINLVENYYDNGIFDSSKNGNNWKNGKKLVPIHPQIAGSVNNSQISAILHSPSFMSQVQTSDGENVTPSDGSSSYQINFDSNDNNLTVAKHNGNSTSAQPDKQTSDPTQGIVFGYNVTAKSAAQYKNRIHYVSYSDMDNAADITQMFNHPGDKSQFLTTVSDTGKNGDQFSDSSYRKNVPKGYQFYKVLKVNSDSDNYQNSKLPGDGKENIQNGLTTFGKSRDQDEYIEVIPNASNIIVHYVNQNGQQIAQHTFNPNSATEQSDGHGHGYTSKFGQFIPETGSESIEKNSDIDLTSSNAQYQLEAQPYHTADGSVDHNSIFMFGRQPQDVKVTVVGKNEESAPITVKYLNHNGTVVRSQAFVGRYNDQVDVAGDHDQNVPSDYKLDPNQQTNYHFGNQPQTIYLDVTGKVIPAHKVTIERVLEQSDGTPKIDDSKSVTFGSDNPNSSSSDIQGSTKEVNPDSYTPDGYVPDYSHDSVQFITMNADKNTMPNKIVFYYRSKTTNAAPVTVHFMNQDGQIVGVPDYISGNLGDTVSASNSKITAAVPQGYSLNPNQAQSVTLSNSPQTMLLKVIGKSYNNSFKMNVVTENSDGTNTKTTPVNIHVTGNVGDRFTISPYEVKSGGDISSISDGSNRANGLIGELNGGSYQVPIGYHANDSDSDVHEIINPDGSLAPLSHINFIYQSNGQPEAPLDKIRIHYVTDNVNLSKGVDINGAPKDRTQVDQESDEGYSDQTQFDLTPYLHDIPESVSQFYDIDGSQAFNKNDQAINSSWTFGQTSDGYKPNDSGGVNNIRDVYIKISKNNNDQPIVVD